MSTARLAARRRARGLGARLLAAQLLVVLAGALTAWLVAAAVGPKLFHDHLRRAGHAAAAAEARHAEEAFRSANAISLSVALLAALACALVVSLYVTRRVGRSVGTVADAASDVAAGHYDARVRPSGLGAEFDQLAGAFNEMADRLQSMETTRRRLLADLAHEMRTPVATLSAYLEGIEDGVARFDADTAAVLQAQTTRLSRLSEDISAVSRAEEQLLEPHPRPVAPAELVGVAVTSAADRYAAKGVHLLADLPADLPAVQGDPDRLGQVLGNLLDNALRHTPAGGTVTLRARTHLHELDLTVSDTGEGIPAEHLPHVFERFYRVDAARDRTSGGSGIGLAISKAITQAHGGRITAVSDGPGRGASFTIRLPAP